MPPLCLTQRCSRVSPLSFGHRVGRRACLVVRSSTLDVQKPATIARSGHHLMDWLQDSGAPDMPVEIRSVDAGTGRPFDMVVARGPISAGQLVIDVPDNLVITLDRIFESEFVAELLSNGKLSELACLTLFLMYEKKTGQQSFWSPYIKELDRQRARGAQAVESPLLWSDEELEELLQGSPLLAMVQQRLVGIREEYEALDTVWFMASSLFNKYPFDIPTEAFPFNRFRQAFAAVQASIVHLQGVPSSKRFALVPLGPPLLSYSSTSKAMITYNKDKGAVQLTADRDYRPGEPLTAWCGPQPNSRLLLNYGLVDEGNPYDKLQMTVTIPNSDPLFRAKRTALQPHSLTTQHTFDLGRNKPLPPALLPFMRLALSTTEEQVQRVWFPAPPPPRPSGPPPGMAAAASGGNQPAAPGGAAAAAAAAARGRSSGSASSSGSNGSAPPMPPAQPEGPPASSLSPDTEALAVSLLTGAFNMRLAAYRHPLWRDLEVIADAAASPRQKIAARLTKIEKTILSDCLESLKQAAGGQLPTAEHAAQALAASAIKFE